MTTISYYWLAEPYVACNYWLILEISDFSIQVAFTQTRSYYLYLIAKSKRLYLVMLVVDTYDMMITAELTSLMFNIQCSPETTDCGKTLNWTFWLLVNILYCSCLASSCRQTCLAMEEDYHKVIGLLKISALAPLAVFLTVWCCLRTSDLHLRHSSAV